MSVVSRPYQLAPRAVQNHFRRYWPIRAGSNRRGGGGGGLTSQELFKIVGILSSISLLENGRVELNIFHILVNLLAFLC